VLGSRVTDRHAWTGQRSERSADAGTRHSAPPSIPARHFHHGLRVADGITDGPGGTGKSVQTKRRTRDRPRNRVAALRDPGRPPIGRAEYRAGSAGSNAVRGISASDGHGVGRQRSPSLPGATAVDGSEQDALGGPVVAHQKADRPGGTGQAAAPEVRVRRQELTSPRSSTVIGLNNQGRICHPSVRDDRARRRAGTANTTQLRPRAFGEADRMNNPGRSAVRGDGNRGGGDVTRAVSSGP